MNIRRTVFSGSWYPSGALECEKEIRQFLQDSNKADDLQKDVKGGIVPHAGWYFSGSIACNVIRSLKQEATPDVIFIFGMHLHPESSPYIMTEGSWETPFGALPVEQEIAKELTRRFDFKIESCTDFSPDNTIELQLPFIKYFFNDVSIVPVGVPPGDISVEIGEYAAEVADKKGIRAKVVGSTDLTHYGQSYGFSPKGRGMDAHKWVRDENDSSIINAMLKMDAIEVLNRAAKEHNACCAGAAAAAISAAKKLGSKGAESLSYATSYEKNPGDSFVGYVGIIF